SSLLFLLLRSQSSPTLFPYTTLFRSSCWKYRCSLTLMAAAWSTFCWPAMSACATVVTWSRSMLPPVKPTCVVKKRRLVGTERERSEEHTSELQSRENLVCCVLLEKKN